MEFGSIDREIYVEASPEVVFEVISSPEHLTHWWPDEARYDATPGSTGEIVFGDSHAGGNIVQLTVLESRPPRTFSFRWTQPLGEEPAEGNSLLVTFELSPSGDETLLRFSETGFREMGWEAAVLEAQYQDHVSGWSVFLPRIAPYAATVQAAVGQPATERALP